MMVQSAHERKAFRFRLDRICWVVDTVQRLVVGIPIEGWKNPIQCEVEFKAGNKPKITYKAMGKNDGIPLGDGLNDLIAETNRVFADICRLCKSRWDAQAERGEKPDHRGEYAGKEGK